MDPSAKPCAIELEEWFQSMQKSGKPAPIQNKLARAWLDGYNAGLLAKVDDTLRALTVNCVADTIEEVATDAVTQDRAAHKTTGA